MEQPNARHRGAPPSHLLKHDSRAIVSALVLDGGDFAQQAQGAGTEPPNGGADDEEGDEQ